MKPRYILGALAAAPVLALILWIGSNTTWEEVKVPMPLKGEALTNPLYATQRFAEALGARTTWDRALTIPPADSVIVLSGWHWNLSARRREMIEQWVESGGRLVVDTTLIGDDEEFEQWSGIVREYRGEDDHSGHHLDSCHGFHEDGADGSGGPAAVSRLCDFYTHSYLTSRKTALWSLRDGANVQALRVRVGRGSVTVVNATPFRYRSLFDGDHGRVFVRAAGLRRGDEVHFLSEEAHPSLLTLAWRHGSPVVVLALALLVLALWRAGIRFGPPVASAHAGRRSLAEQIHGTARFLLRHGGADSLHAAAVRALNEAARRRISGYPRLEAGTRGAALARLAGFDRDALLTAIYHPRLRRSGELRSTITLLETARRRTLIDRKGTLHG